MAGQEKAVALTTANTVNQVEGKVNGKVPSFRGFLSIEEFEGIAAENGNAATIVTQDQVETIFHRYQIDLSEELAPPPVAMAIKDETGKEITLFTKGNFSIITGFAKSKKSFLASMLLAEAVGKKGNFFVCRCSGVNALFDTEQSKYKVQQIAKRIVKMAGTDSGLRVYSLRTLEPNKRRQVIREFFENTPDANFIIIDGIVDLDIDPILQADQAQSIIQDLMKWSEDYGVHICCILHYNKSVETLLGHLGSMGHRKADAIISATKDKQDKNISIVDCVDAREIPFESFAFQIDEDGLPQIIGVRKKDEATGRQALMPTQIPDETHYNLIQEIFEGKPDGIQPGDLKVQLQLKYNSFGIKFGENKTRSFLAHCENLGFVVPNGEQGKKARYLFNPVSLSKKQKLGK